MDTDETTQPAAPPENIQPKNPLHGVTLEKMLTELVQDIGWEAMAQRIKVRCFTHDPSIPSSLKFLRKTPWAREKVESMYLYLLRRRAREVKAAQANAAPGNAMESSAVDPGATHTFREEKEAN